MRIWRLVKTKYASEAFNGEGARQYGGRWNSAGVAAAYGSDSAALAVLEVLVHLKDTTVLSSYSLVTATIPDGLIGALDQESLPSGWNDFPVPPAVQAMGDAWLGAGKALALLVPSVVVSEGRNVLINPEHQEFERIVIDAPKAFRFDPRLVK